jgi:hypothetical protein
MSNNTVNTSLRRVGFTKGETTGHGFRAMASTLLNEQGLQPDAIELQSAYVDRNNTRTAYNRAQRLAQRKQIIQDWPDLLGKLKAHGVRTDRSPTDRRWPAADAMLFL